MDTKDNLNIQATSQKERIVVWIVNLNSLCKVYGKKIRKVCSEFSNHIVIQGIESEIELSAAHYAQASSVQGNLIATPACNPSWLEGKFSIVKPRDLRMLHSQNNLK